MSNYHATSVGKCLLQLGWHRTNCSTTLQSTWNHLCARYVTRPFRFTAFFFTAKSGKFGRIYREKWEKCEKFQFLYCILYLALDSVDYCISNCYTTAQPYHFVSKLFKKTRLSRVLWLIELLLELRKKPAMLNNLSQTTDVGGTTVTLLGPFSGEKQTFIWENLEPVKNIRVRNI